MKIMTYLHAYFSIKDTCKVHQKINNHSYTFL